MDQATQQNAALVEEMAAAASSLKSQASDLVQVVAVFKLSDADLGSAARTPVVATATSATRQLSPALGKKGAAPAALAKPVAPRPAPPSKAKAAPQLAAVVPKTSTKVTPAGGDDDWETF
jgi:methyl-accepting chemotaxis protein